ncbi:Big1p LALA0_S01e16688g [Lachancea lanzarotensis]|uniref:Protein BIG1 n=1 Tax=Lachancea lanzarotensis TaxID=1245769 RepID=A0A0C7N5G7_9SACH|nr:uncharacterized protein LALA0_S01e16688g [Lachancea lanzarotensis]CEP60688.1 LALA0S01e16688g1_1 [Lachancea lanzarotensis]
MRLFTLRNLAFLGTLISSSLQESVPAVLSSHQLTSGLLKYQEDYDSANVLPQELFLEIAEKFISGSRSDAYLFINIPGLRASDFSDHREQLKTIEKYLETSSTALRFENLEIEQEWEEVFDKLVSYTEEEWDITDRIELWSDHIDAFERYIDWRPRTVRIEFEQAPAGNRAGFFAYCDRTIKHVLGQIPSSDTKIVLTSRTGNTEETESPTRIFSDIFEDPQKKTDIEKNKHTVQKKHELNTPHPRFTGMVDSRLSLVDPAFLKQHGTTIKMIIISSLTYAVAQLILWNRTKGHTRLRQKVAEQKKNQ